MGVGYVEVIAFVQEVLAALGMAAVLYKAGLWDEPPLEKWSHVRAAATAEAERAAARADAAQFDGQAEEHDAGQEAAAMATELEGAEEDEAEEAATAAATEVAVGSRSSKSNATHLEGGRAAYDCENQRPRQSWEQDHLCADGRRRQGDWERRGDDQGALLPRQVGGRKVSGEEVVVVGGAERASCPSAGDGGRLLQGE